MTVYVDNARIPARVGRINARWSHLTSDSKPELFEFAERIGLRRAWFQTCKRSASCRPAERCPHWHFDETDSKRSEAIDAGAVEIDIREWSDLIRARRAAMAASVQPLPDLVPPRGWVDPDCGVDPDAVGRYPL